MARVYRSFASAMKTSTGSGRRNDSYTDADYAKKRDENLRTANSAHSREMHQIMKGKK